MSANLSLDSAEVPRYYRVRILEGKDEVANQVVVMLEGEVAGFSARLKATLTKHQTAEIHPA